MRRPRVAPRRATLVAALLLALLAMTATAVPARAESRPTLGSGSRGSAVVALQQRLAALRYDIGPIDGWFGYSTLHAVVAFQKVNRLSRDGIVGPRTWYALDHPIVPWPRYGRSGAGLEVDLTRQVVYYTAGGAVGRILDASTGSGAWYSQGGAWHRAVTPTGTFRIGWRINAWHLSPLGWMYRPSFFYGGYAVHGSGSVPPYPASHGCVRVTVPAMDRLWPALWSGMPVAVYW